MDAPINDPTTISKFLIQPADPPALAILIYMNKLQPTVRQLLFPQPARQALAALPQTSLLTAMEAAGTHHTVPLDFSLIEANRPGSSYLRPHSTTAVFSMTPSIYDANATNGPDPESLLVQINTTVKQKHLLVV